MGSVIRVWQGLGGLKLTRLMAEQTAQSQLSPAHELDSKIGHQAFVNFVLIQRSL